MRIYLCGAVLLALSMVAVFHAAPHWFFAHYDGNLYLTLITQQYKHTSVFRPWTLNPYQGMGTQFLPFNIWINPCYLVIGYFAASDGSRLASGILAALFYYSSIFLLTRSLNVKPVASTCAALLLTYIILPPTGWGMIPKLCVMLNPGYMFICSLMIFALALYNFTIAAESRMSRIGFGLAFIAMVVYSFNCDFFWSFVFSLMVGVLMALECLVSFSQKKCIDTILLGLSTGIVLAMCNVVDLSIAWMGLNQRCILGKIVASEYQIPIYTFFPWDSISQNSIDFIIFIFIAVFLTLYPRKWLGTQAIIARRKIVILVLAFGIGSAVYLFSGMSWKAPLPFYWDGLTIGVFGSLLFSYGFGLKNSSELLNWLKQKWGQFTSFVGVLIALCRQWLKQKWGQFAAAVVGLIVLCGGWWAVCSSMVGTNPFPKFYAIEDDRPFCPIVKSLIESSHWSIGEPFPGYVYLLSEGASKVSPYDPGVYLGLFTIRQVDLNIMLTRWDVPIFYEYGQNESTPLTFMDYSAFQFHDKEITRNFFDPEMPNLPLMRRWGLAYYVTYFNLDPKDAELIQQYQGDKITLNLYKIKNPNIKGYSPSKIICESNPSKTLEILSSDETDPSLCIVNDPALNVKYDPIQSSDISLAKGALHVRATSAGRGNSMLVIPFQYSNYIVARDNGGHAPPRVVRVNFNQMGLVFNGTMDANLEYDRQMGYPKMHSLAEWRDYKSFDFDKELSSRQLPTQRGQLYSWDDWMLMLPPFLQGVGPSR